jgi:O-antigen/teichoic acid export membrane protein
MGDDRERLVEGYMRIMRMLSFVIFPIMLGLVAIAPEMFMLLLGEKWMPTVPFFEILALAGLFYPLGVVSYNILKVLSDGRVILRLEVVKRVIMTLILVYTIPQGIESIAWGMSAMAVVEFALNTLFAMRYMNMGMMPLLSALLPSLLLACAMFGGLHLIAPYLGDMHTALRLLSMVAIGGVVYLCGAWLLRLNAFNECIGILKGLCRR